MSNIRGIRGAITAKNTKSGIVEATTVLLKAMVALNKIKTEDIASVIFSVTSDLNAEFPAVAARKMGWRMTPLLCTNEIKVRGSLKKCIRILMHVNSEKPQSRIRHIYMGGAIRLRPDLR
jgi:chorismate mutase